MENNFWNQKKSRPYRHKSAKIIGPCQYVCQKSVGPVFAMTVGRSIIWLGVWGCRKPTPPPPPPSGSRAGLGWGSSGLWKSRILHYQKWSKNNKIVSIFELLGRIVLSCLIRLQKHFKRWVPISVKILNNSGESKKEYTRLTSHITASVASVLKIRLALDR